MQLCFDLSSGLPAAPTPVVPAQPEPAAAPLLAEPVAAQLKHKVAAFAGGQRATAWGAVPFGDARIDAHLPGGGLPRGRLHEIAGAGSEQEIPAAATGFTALLAQRCAGAGAILWALQRDDLYAPGLAPFGIDPDRLVFVRGDKDDDILAIVESGLRTRGISCVIGEAAALDLTAARRLQLVSEHGGATAFILRRRLYSAPRGKDSSTATTRWRIAPAPSEAREPGLGPPRWKAQLERCRGGRPGAWIMEAADAESDAPGAVRLVAELADHTLEARGDAAGPPRARDDGAGRQRHASAGG